MAVEIVHKKQTGEAAAATLAITSATAGNLLVCFLSKIESLVEPKGQDNIGTAGWTTISTKSVYGEGKHSIWAMTKIAVGGETTLEPKIEGGTAEGLSYFEVGGASATLDKAVHTDNGSSVKTLASPSLTTTDAGDVILAAVGMGNTSGTITAWTGTGPEMTNVETTTTRCFGGSLIPAALVEAKTFTGNWTTARNAGLLLVSLKPETVVKGKTTGTLLLTGTSKGLAIQKVEGKATGAFLLTGTSKGLAVQVVQGKATGAILFTGTSKGTVTGGEGVQGKATGALILSGTSKGLAVQKVTGKGTGALLLTGTATGIAAQLVTGKATGALLLTGTATGAAVQKVTGQASGALIFTGRSKALTPAATSTKKVFIAIFED